MPFLATIIITLENDIDSKHRGLGNKHQRIN
jgi:hypothetical protein